jgi:hypothetical protein
MHTDEKHRLDATRLRVHEGWSIGRAAQGYGVDPQDRPVKRVNWPRVAFAGLLAATVTILVTLRFQTTSERNLQAVSGGPSAATEVSFPPKADLPSTLQLVAEPASEGTDSRWPLGIFVRGPSELASAAAIEIIGLPSGWALSAGRPLGNRWRIPAPGLSSAAILPPRRFFGAVDLEVELRLADDTLVERRSVRRAMTDQELAAEETMLFVSRAESMLVQGDISAARLGLRRAAEVGNARAALLLGETYEGCLRYPLLRCSADADRATARAWYEMAAKYGSAEARQRLDRLGSEQ